MAVTPAPVSRDWLRTQVEAYAAARTRYAAAADLLRTVLTTLCRTVAASAQVQARAKSVASFGEKALRSAAWTHDPVHDFTDLCGVRVIVSTRGEVHAVAQLLRQTLPVEEGLGGDAGERLGRQAFGYRSLHLVLSLPPGAVAGVLVPAETVGLRAELQVRTVAKHAWADFAHDRTYNGFPDAASLLQASWQLPGSDSHRQADDQLTTEVRLIGLSRRSSKPTWRPLFDPRRRRWPTRSAGSGMTAVMPRAPRCARDDRPIGPFTGGNTAQSEPTSHRSTPVRVSSRQDQGSGPLN
jgi:ppGpp synthetase/RelA/SpoT-type nucleotidyltranferase